MILSLALAGIGAGTPGPILIDLFVDASASCAAGNGTAATPFCSIDEAVAVAVNGDVIRIAAGTYVENLTLAANVTLVGTDGQALTTLDGGASGTVVTVQTGATVSLDGLTITNGGDSGIVNRGGLTLTNCTVSNSSPAAGGYYGGGGIFCDAATGPTTLRNCTIAGNDVPNTAGYLGGGLYAYGSGPVTIEDSTFSGNYAPYGGAFFVDGTDLTLVRSTVSGNTSNTFGVAYSIGGGNLTIVNSTIADNAGGGVEFLDGSCVIRSTTITGNDGLGYSGGAYAFGTTPITITNSIVAGQVNALYGADVIGGFTSAGHNLIGSFDPTGATGFAAGVNGDQVGTPGAPIDPLVGPLGDNGGPTFTRIPLAGSPAVDAGDQVVFEPTDQRGVVRTAGTVNIGSVEDGFGGAIPGCTANPNSTGSVARISGSGSTVAADDDLTLRVDDLPPNQFGIFIASLTPGFLPNPGGSQGNLCLSGAIGRFRDPNQILSSGPGGSFSLRIPLTQIPQGAGTVTAAAGETWNFQAWFRDVAGGMATSNFSDGLQLTFH